MELKVIHLETHIQSVFGLLDDQGNVVQQVVVRAGEKVDDPLLIKKFTKEAFDNAYSSLLNVRSQIQEKVNKQSE